MTTEAHLATADAASTNGWPIVPFGQLVENHDGRRVPLKAEDRRRRPGPYPYYGASGIIDSIDDFLFDGDFLLIGEDGANLLARATPIAFLASGRFWVNNHAHVVRPKEGVLLDYLIHWFAQADISEYVTGSAQPKLSQAKLNEILVPLPPLAEQRRIAGRLREQLAEVAKARTAVQAQLAAAQALPAACRRGAFQASTGECWETKTLRDVADISGGMQKTPGRVPVKFHRPFLTVRNVQRGFLDLSKVERFEVTPAELERLRLCRGDLLIVEGNGSIDHIGRNAVFTEDGEWIHQNHIIRVRLRRDVLLPEFVSQFLNSDAGCEQMLEKAKTTTGLYTLSTAKVSSLEVPVPPLDEQRTVAARLASELAEATQLQKSLSEKLAAINRLPAALLAQAFQGTESSASAVSN